MNRSELLNYNTSYERINDSASPFSKSKRKFRIKLVVEVE